MVPNGSAYSNFPSFANNGTKTPPGGSTESAKYALGMVPADTFPAEWANYLFHGATAGITRLNLDTASIKKELNSILAAYNITNDASAYDQLLTALGKIYPQMCECITPATTAAKSISIQGNVLKPGNVYVVEMKYGTTVSNPTLSINGGTSYPICDAEGTPEGYGAWQAGDFVKFLFTGSKFLKSTESARRLLNLIYPVGSLYWTTNSVNPSQYFGGTWVQIKDRFVLAAGDTYPITTPPGGVAEVTLSIDQIPSHAHEGYTGIETSKHTHNGSVIDYYEKTVYDSQTSVVANINSNSSHWIGNEGMTATETFTTDPESQDHVHTIPSQGGGQPHTNMPPFIVRYCWERTA